MTTTTMTDQAMRYRRFGRTELQMPVFSCGGMRYQDGWADKPLDQVAAESQKNLEATIHRSIELGINHIETARGYGCSERQLGVVLPTLPRDQIIVQTKVGPSDDPDEFVANVRDSMERLQLDYVDLLAIHGLNDHRTLWMSCRNGGCLAAARKLQAEGVCRHVGFSTHGPTDVIVSAIQEEAEGGFDYVNLHWYYIFQNNWPAIEAATERDMGVFIISPSDKGGKLYDPPDKLVELCEPLSPMVFNDLFCLSHEQVHTLSIGAARPSDFDEHVKTLPYMDDAKKVLEPIDSRLRAAMIEAVGEDAFERYTEGLPQWYGTPGFVNIPLVLWLRNLALGWDMLDYAKMRYNMIGNGGHWFPGGNAAYFNEEKIRKLSEKSPLGEKLIDYLNEAHELLGGEERKRLSQGG